MAQVEEVDDFELARRLQEEEIERLGQNQNLDVNGLRAPLLNQENDDEENQEPNQPSPSASAVRQTFIRAIYEIQRNSPTLVFLYALYAIVEICSTIIMTTVYWDQNCGTDIQKWLLLFSSRLFVVIPLHIWKIRDPSMQFKITQLLNHINIGAIILFVLGQKWVFESTCRGPLYSYCIAILIMMYTSLMFPCFVLIMLCLCAPVLMYAFQRFAIGSEAATEVELNDLPTEVFEPDNEEDEEEMCSVCITEYEQGDQVMRLPCGHRFHQDCIISWLRIKRICPLCRNDIRQGQPQA